MALRIAFFGVGELAEPYLRALARLPELEMAGVCDADRRAAETVAAGWNTRVFSAYDRMLEETRPDALWICLDSHLQSDVILKAAALRIPFFVVPPGAADFERLYHCAQAVRDARVTTAVGFQASFVDLMKEAREYVGANTVPLAIGWWLAVDEGVADAADLLWKKACFHIDAMRYFCGPVARVRTLSSHGGGIILQLEFVGGTVGTLTCATFARPEPRRELELLGEGWSMLFGDQLQSLQLAEQDKTTILRSLNNPAQEATIAFLEAIAGKPTPQLISYLDAVETLAVCQAAFISQRENRVVELREELRLPAAKPASGN